MPRIFELNPQSPDDSILKEAAELIKTGKLIIYPTETFYAIGALYSNEQALKRIFDIKSRDKTKPVLLIIHDIASLYKLSTSVSQQSLSIAQRFWPGPLTLLFTASPQLSHLLMGNSGKVGCRISSNLVAKRLLHFLKDPITSTSANLSGGKSPKRTDEIPETLLDSVDIILDAGETPGDIPSTIMDVSDHPFTVVREGAIPSGEIFNYLA
jgi:L-threonylcarbamoyladenylate synthase